MQEAESRLRQERERLDQERGRLEELERRLEEDGPLRAPNAPSTSSSHGPSPAHYRRRLSSRDSRESREFSSYTDDLVERTRLGRPLTDQALLDKDTHAHLHSDTIQREPIEDVPGIVELFSKSGGIVPLAVHVAEVEAMQQAATRLQVMSQKCDEQLEQLEQREKNAEDILLSEDSKQVKILQYAVADMRGMSKEILTRKDILDETVGTLLTRFERASDKGIELFVPMLLKTVEKYNYNFGEFCFALEHTRAFRATCSGCGDMTHQRASLYSAYWAFASHVLCALHIFGRARDDGFRW